MFTVKITTPSSRNFLERQTPGRDGVWRDCRFIINKPVQECDLWVVFEGLPKTESVACPRTNTILITGEPPSVKSYDPKFIRQFGTIVTSHPKIKHPNVLHSQQALPWFIGYQFTTNSKTLEDEYSKDYDELKSSPLPAKTKLLSVVASTKNTTRGHRERSAFVERLQSHFGDQIDVFGRGRLSVADKWDAIAPYKYHIALENSAYPDYWTEKLSDTYLAGAYPFYYGCPNLERYFPTGAFTPINIADPDAALRAIDEAMRGDRYQKAQADLATSKELVLDTYNLFPMIYTMLTERFLPLDTQVQEMVTIEPERVKKVYWNKLKNKIRRSWSR